MAEPIQVCSCPGGPGAMWQKRPTPPRLIWASLLWLHFPEIKLSRHACSVRIDENPGELHKQLSLPVRASYTHPLPDLLLFRGLATRVSSPPARLGNGCLPQLL